MIEIHLHGKPGAVTKLQAAREAANLGDSFEYHGVRIGEPSKDGWIESGYVEVRGRRYAYGEMQPTEISWGAWGEVSIADARQQAEQIALAVQVAELAEMIAAEQVTEFTTSSLGGVPAAPCLVPERHSRQLAGASVDCDVAGHHGPARISEAAIDKALAATLGVCPASTGPDDELDREVYCDKQLGEDSKHAGNHHARVGLGDVDGGEVAWGNQDDPYIRKGTRWPSDAGAASPFADGPGCGQRHPNHTGAERFACDLHRNGFHTAPGNPGMPGCQWPIRRDEPATAPEPSGISPRFPCCEHCRLPEGSVPCDTPDAHRIACADCQPEHAPAGVPADGGGSGLD